MTAENIIGRTTNGRNGTIILLVSEARAIAICLIGKATYLNNELHCIYGIQDWVSYCHRCEIHCTLPHNRKIHDNNSLEEFHHRQHAFQSTCQHSLYGNYCHCTRLSSEWKKSTWILHESMIVVFTLSVKEGQLMIVGPPQNTLPNAVMVMPEGHVIAMKVSQF